MEKDIEVYININKGINLKVPESHLTPRDPVTIFSSHSHISYPKETKTQVSLFGLLLTDFEQDLLCFKQPGREWSLHTQVNDVFYFCEFVPVFSLNILKTPTLNKKMMLEHSLLTVLYYFRYTAK